MKKCAILIFVFLTTFLCITLPCHAQRLNVMSFNIRYQNKQDGNNAWVYRKDNVVYFLNEHHPDVFGLQEVLDEQYIFLCNNLSDYAAVGVGRDDGMRKGEYMPVFFLKNRYKLIDSGTFWLSETPNEVSRGWDAACNRICTWVILKHRKSGKRFLFACTHLDHKGKTSRSNAAILIKQRLESISSGLPIVLVGDFNVSEKSEVYETMCSKPYAFNDTWKVAQKCEGLTYTFNGFGKYDATNGNKIDYIFVSPGMKIKNATIFDAHIAEGRYLSDHNAIWAEIEEY